MKAVFCTNKCFYLLFSFEGTDPGGISHIIFYGRNNNRHKESGGGRGRGCKKFGKPDGMHCFYAEIYFAITHSSENHKILAQSNGQESLFVNVEMLLKS